MNDSIAAAYQQDHAARLGHSVGKKLLDEIIDLAGEGSEIAVNAAALSGSDREALGAVLAESLVTQDPIRQALWKLKAMGATVTVGTSDDPHITAIYDRLKEAQKGAPMVIAERTATEATTDPQAKYPVPPESDFRQFEYVDADDIERIADLLIADYPDQFHLLDRFVVPYRWKKEGPKGAGGKDAGGECKKASPHDRYLLGKRVDFFITLYADANRGSTNDGVESLVFHELCHISTTDKGDPAVRPHEFEGFRAEIEERGAWNYGLQRAADGFQARMELS